MLCDHLEGWDREGGREGDARGKRYGYICICRADSLCYKAETNTNVKQLYSNKDVKKKKKIRLPIQGTRVRALVREDPTCRGATKPVRHNY